MKLSQIKKKYPRAFDEYVDFLYSECIVKKNRTEQERLELLCEIHEKTVPVEIRDNYRLIVDHFDGLGLSLYDCEIFQEGVGSMWETNRNKPRPITESAGLSKLFEIREKQLENK